MSQKAVEGIIVTHTTGGMMEFERTGIYPNKLTIKSSEFNHTWRVKVTAENQSGMLKFEKLPVFYYWFDEMGFKIQKVLKGEVKPHFLDFEMRSIMND
jgi:hypothetical protein